MIETTAMTLLLFKVFCVCVFFSHSPTCFPIKLNRRKRRKRGERKDDENDDGDGGGGGGSCGSVPKIEPKISCWTVFVVD